MREERRGWVPLLSFWRRGSFPSASPLQCRDVLSSCLSDVIAVKPDETKCFFFSMSWGDGGWHSAPTPPIPDRWNSLSLRQKTLPMQPGKNAPPSAPSHLLFIVCFLTFISNSFQWHMKSWQGRDWAREGMRDGERVQRGAMKERRRGLSFLFVGNCSMSTSCQTRTKTEMEFDNLDLWTSVFKLWHGH